MFDFSGRTVLVTGGCRGIGRAIAAEFAASGADVAINYRRGADVARQFAEYLRAEFGVRAETFCADVSDEDQARKLASEVCERMGCPAVLVNNAGISAEKPLFERGSDEFRHTLDVNLVGAYNVSKFVGEKMLAEKRGSIVNVSSANAINSYTPQSIDYDCSKAGVIMLTKDMADAFGPYVRVNAVAPGWINAGMNDGLDQATVASESAKAALKRFGSAEEVASVVAFLASDCASYVTGEVIKIDGGWRG